jgi:hypothetical protein
MVAISQIMAPDTRVPLKISPSVEINLGTSGNIQKKDCDITQYRTYKLANKILRSMRLAASLIQNPAYSRAYSFRLSFTLTPYR